VKTIIPKLSKEEQREARKFRDEKIKDDPDNIFNQQVRKDFPDEFVGFDIFNEIKEERNVEKQIQLIKKFLALYVSSSDLIVDNILNKLKEITKIPKSTLKEEFKSLKILLTKQTQIKEIKNKFYKLTSLDDCKKVIKKWLAMPDDDGLDIIFACALDRKIEGEPLWLFVIAVPSGSKTEILRAFEESKDYYHLSDLTVNAFVSGYTFATGIKVEDLADHINEKVLILKDFTSVLSMNKEKRNEILGQLREFYDGFYNKKFGNIDHKVECKSRFGLIAGVTPKVDQFHSIIGQLGERFLKLRWDFDDDLMLDSCEKNESKEKQMREEISEAVMGFITNVKIKEISFDIEHIYEIQKISKYIAKLRTPVTGRWEGDEFVCDLVPQSEKPTRLYKQLKKLTRALCCMHNLEKPNDLILKKLWRVAKDSVPPDRQAIYDYVSKKGITNEQTLFRDLKIPRTTGRRILNVLYRIGVIDANYKDQDQNQWFVTQREEHRVLQKNGSGDPPNLHTISSCVSCGVNLKQELMNGNQCSICKPHMENIK